MSIPWHTRGAFIQDFRRGGILGVMEKVRVLESWFAACTTHCI